MTAHQRQALSGGWHGRELALDRSWVLRWTDAELDDLDAALAAIDWEAGSWDRAELSVSPRLQARLRAVAQELEHGRGLVKLEGLPVGRYSTLQLKALWFGLARHLGTPVFQDSRGQLMREIRDEGGDLGARHGRLVDDGTGEVFLSSKARTYGSGALRFHTDRCDVVGLLTLGRALRGGLSKLASSIAVHNVILERRPDLLELLYRPFYRSRLGEEEGGESHVYPLPVFGLRDGRLTSHYSRTYIEAAQRQPGTPPMSAAQWEAIDLLAAVAEELCFTMRLAPGDIQLLNNHVVYHARTPFEDDPACGQVRRLLRVWLAMPNSRALPADHKVLWRKVEAGALRGGIGQEPLRRP